MTHSRSDNLANKKTRKTGLFATSILWQGLASLLILLLRVFWQAATVDLPMTIKAAVCYFTDSSIYDDWCEFSRDAAQTDGWDQAGVAVCTVGEGRRDGKGWSDGSSGAGWMD